MDDTGGKVALEIRKKQILILANLKAQCLQKSPGSSMVAVFGNFLFKISCNISRAATLVLVCVLVCSGCGTIDPSMIHDLVRTADQTVLKQPDQGAMPVERIWDEKVSPYVKSVFKKVKQASGYAGEIELEILKTDRVQAFGGVDFFAPSVQVTRGMLNSIVVRTSGKANAYLGSEHTKGNKNEDRVLGRQ